MKTIFRAILPISGPVCWINKSNNFFLQKVFSHFLKLLEFAKAGFLKLLFWIFDTIVFGPVCRLLDQIRPYLVRLFLLFLLVFFAIQIFDFFKTQVTCGNFEGLSHDISHIGSINLWICNFFRTTGGKKVLFLFNSTLKISDNLPRMIDWQKFQAGMAKRLS